MDKKLLLLLLTRPKEPTSALKDVDGTYFDIPLEYLTDRRQAVRSQKTNKVINVKKITQPDLTIPMSLGRSEQFSLWIPKHKKIAGRLIDIFMSMKTSDDLLSSAIYARDRVNPLLFNYALSVVLLHRPDTMHMPLPSFLGSFPDHFVDPVVFSKLKEEATMVEEGNRIPIIIPTNFTYSDDQPEQKLWYFREDIGANLHHFHWHLVYPFGPANYGLIDKDRRGELFYYMHGQFIARYNFERYSLKMPKAVPLVNLREPIAQGYFPKLNSTLASRSWPGRPDNVKLQDLNRQHDEIRVSIAEVEEWRKRFLEAIEQGYVTDVRGNRVELDEMKGIDILGNMMEASEISINYELYGDLHNAGHLFISFAHDPEGRYLEPQGIMGNSAVAMRDPTFYRWHSHVDDIFQLHKIKLTPYTVEQLNFPGITVTDVSVTCKNSDPNILHTCWEQSDIDFSHGLDFVFTKGSVYARFTHLTHEQFTYTVKVNNEKAPCQGLMRIFLTPQTDENGKALTLTEQRLLMIELDKFVVTLKPGQNTIRRRDTDSTVTIPYERTFRNYAEHQPAEATPAFEQYNYCGCGWPDHLLIPRGSPEGLLCSLFVMVSNYDEDKVEQSLDGICNDAVSYCGVRDRLYPDKKAMGYPFDRFPRVGSDTLATFVTPNMFVQSCTIIHTDRTVQRPR